MCAIAASLLALTALPAPVMGQTLQVSRSSTVVADQVSLLAPKALPGSDVDCYVTVTNAATNVLLTVGAVTIVDPVSPQAKLRVADYAAAGSGPVSFVDGNLLNLGLLGSGLTYRFVTLDSRSDGIEFSDGKTWTYVPVPDADGFDANVRAIRVTLTGNQAAGGAFQLRYRTRLR